MKYKYCHKDKDGKKQKGEIVAKDREDAFRLLREQGLQHVAVYGDNPAYRQIWAILTGRASLTKATFKYSYQDKDNQNCEGEIVAKCRDDAYKMLRKQGIRPYRVVGDDPLNWKPWAISAGYVILSVALIVVGVIAMSQAKQLREMQMLEAEEIEGNIY